MDPTKVALLPAWLEPPELPGVTYRFRDGGDPLPDESILDRVTFYVPPYMGPMSDVALAGRMPRLEVLQTLTAGVDAMAQHLPVGARLIRAVGVHDDSTAELAVGLMIAAQRGIDSAARNMPDGIWDPQRWPALADSRVGIVGWGGVGRSIAARLKPFAAPVTGFTRSGADGAQPLTELDAALPNLDIVVLALPHTPETHHFMDAERLRRMAPGALLVNVGRGPLVDTSALVTAVRTDRLRAALDVTDPEPLPADHPLWRLPGVLITPHVGGNSEAFPPRARHLIAEQLRCYAAGMPLIT